MGVVAWYRLRATLARRWVGYLALVLLIGLVGGLALAALAGARRTQSAYPAFLSSTNPSDLTMVGLAPNKNGRLLDAIPRLPGVKHAETFAALSVGPIARSGAPTRAARAEIALGSIDGLGFDQDRLTATQGRLADPKRADEVVVTADDARLLGVRLNQTVRIGVFTSQQIQSPGFGTAKVQPTRRVAVKVVGIVKFNNTVVQDDVDANGDQNMVFTPAFTDPLTRCCVYDLYSGFQVSGGSRGVSSVESEIERALPADSGYYVHVTSIFEAQAERAVKPEAIALGAFGVIAALAMLLLAGQMIGRQLRSDSADLDALRAIGADRRMTVADGLIGLYGSIAVGSILAVAVAVSLSPLAPIGPARSVYPTLGLAFDWTVLGVGLVVFIAILSATALALAWRRAPDRGRLDEQPSRRGPLIAHFAATAGLPVAAVAGIRFALESGRARDATPARSAIFGTVIAVIVVTATLTFGTSLHTLVSHPSLYGWNWNDEIVTQGGGGNIPLGLATKLLEPDRFVQAWSGVNFDSLRIDGQTVPIMGGQPNATVAPPLLTGHTLEAADQIVMGGTTLAQLHKRVGETVEATYGPSQPTTLRIVGTATMPAVGPADQLHLSMGVGALVSYRLLPAAVRNSGGGSGTAFEPSAIFVRLRPGANPVTSLATLRRQVAATSGELSVVSDQRPAEIVNYRSMGATPMLLGGALAVAAVLALGLTLIASVRRHRRDLAMFKALGFTRRQLGAAVAWQSTTAVLIGIVVGAPLGIIGGRALWDLFADELHVRPEPTVPALTILLVAIGSLVLANIVATVPGINAARTPAADQLRAG